jgi:hypothetical protein
MTGIPTSPCALGADYSFPSLSRPIRPTMSEPCNISIRGWPKYLERDISPISKTAIPANRLRFSCDTPELIMVWAERLSRSPRPEIAMTDIRTRLAALTQKSAAPLKTYTKAVKSFTAAHYSRNHAAPSDEEYFRAAALWQGDTEAALMACYCRPAEACHADIWLALANDKSFLG